MAKELKADVFVISTAVEKVSLNYKKPNQLDLSTITTADAKEYIKQGHFAPGSMLPKIQAAVDFVESTNGMALITDPENLYDAIYSDKGTKIVKG